MMLRFNEMTPSTVDFAVLWITPIAPPVERPFERTLPRTCESVMLRPPPARTAPINPPAVSKALRLLLLLASAESVKVAGFVPEALYACE